LINALVAKQNHPFEIYAVTRDKSSRGAQALASKSNVKVIEGDFKAPDAIFRQVEKPWGLFSVTMPMNAAVEESQGKAIAAAALSAGVSHIVFTSVERGVNQATDPTPVPHFRSKFNIEKEIESLAHAKPSLSYTFLNPVAFMDNVTPDFFGKVFGTLWSFNGPSTKLQLVATSDIGKIAAEAFIHADQDEYKNKRVSIAGDDLTPAEAKTIFQEVTGKSLPETYGFVGRVIKWLAYEQLGYMFDWFKTDGYSVDIKALRASHPSLKDFRAWLAEESAWKKT